MTKFIKSLGLLVDVCICCSPLGYNKRTSWKKKEIFIYLAVLGMFVGKWWAIWAKLPSLGGCWVSSWVWIQQQPVTASRWLSLSIAHGNLSPFLPWSGDTKGFWGADCWLSWSEPRNTMLLLTGDPFFCTSWLRMLSGSDALRLAWQGLALFSWAAPGLSLPWQHCDCTRATALLGWHFLKELASPRVSVHRWMPWSFVPTGLTAVPLHWCLWNFSSFTEMQRRVQSNLTVLKEARLDLLDQTRWKLRWIRKKICPLTNHRQPVLWWGIDGPRRSQHLPEEPNWLKWCRGWLLLEVTSLFPSTDGRRPYWDQG